MKLPMKLLDGSRGAIPISKRVREWSVVDYQEKEVRARASSTSRRRRFQVPSNQEQFLLVQKALIERRHARQRRQCSHAMARQLVASNPWAGDLWVRCLEEALLTQSVQPTFFVTVFDGQFEVDESRLRGGLAGTWLADTLPQLSSTVRNRFRGVPFLLQLDLAIHRHGRQYRSVVCPHWHGLAWGSRRKVGAIMSKFGTGFGGAPGGRKSPIYNLRGALDYLAKDTRAQYVTVPPREDNHGARFHHTETVTLRHRRLLLEILDEWAKPELCVGSRNRLRGSEGGNGKGQCQRIY